MLTFEAMTANIRLLCEWSKRTDDISDPLSEPYPEHHGHEEIDEFGQAVLDDGSGYEDPPTTLRRIADSNSGVVNHRDESCPVAFSRVEFWRRSWLASYLGDRRPRKSAQLGSAIVGAVNFLRFRNLEQVTFVKTPWRGVYETSTPFQCQDFNDHQSPPSQSFCQFTHTFAVSLFTRSYDGNSDW